MSYREIPINAALGVVTAVGESIGLKKKIEVSDHSVNVSLTLPDQDSRAWDPDMFKKSNLFVKGYANPIKPRVNYNQDLENPDTVDVTEGSPGEDDDTNADAEDETDDTDASDGPHVSLISSARYRDYMRQDLVSQLLTPQEQWKLIAYGILGLGMLVFFQMVVIFWINGGGPA